MRRAHSKARSDGTDAAGFSGCAAGWPVTLRPCVRQGRTKGRTPGAMGNGRRGTALMPGIRAGRLNRPTKPAGRAQPLPDARRGQSGQRSRRCQTKVADSPRPKADQKPTKSRSSADHHSMATGGIGCDRIARRAVGGRTRSVTPPDVPKTAARPEKRQTPASRPERRPRPSTPVPR